MCPDDATVDALERALEVPYTPPPLPSGREILKEVAERRGIPLEKIFSKSRRREIARVRHEIAYEIRRIWGRKRSFPQIAAIMGYKDHTSAVWAVWLHAELNGLPHLTTMGPNRNYRARARMGLTGYKRPAITQ